MARRNRVTPLSELVADPARGLVYGNRGCLHDAAGQIRRRYAGRRWIACRLRFRGWQRTPLLQPGRFTELFFLDEATAMAAGHRACALCRRADYDRLVALWRELHPGQVGADAIDAQLHGERVAAGTRAQRHHEAPLDDLPDAAFVLRDGAPWLVLGGRAAGLDARGLRRARAAAHARARAWSSRRPRWSRCCAPAGTPLVAAAAPVGRGPRTAPGDDGDEALARRDGLVVARRLDHDAHELLGAAGADEHAPAALERPRLALAGLGQLAARHRRVAVVARAR